MPGDAPVSRLKIILLGDAAAGKTKLMQRFLVDGFNPRRLATHAVNIFPYTAKGTVENSRNQVFCVS
jgi:Rab-like protein 2